ncbi:MAG TPA: cytochrome c oxidase subunit 2A [Gemmatimonadota bacterium]|nr:cytochrome c oxidase subunit 2A [Gemmatimonadota bacterium]
MEDDRGTPDEEPQLSGTLFIVMVIIILTAGMWAAVYFTLLER